MTEVAKKGRWRPGTSGNPAGRRPGSGDVAKFRAAIAARIPDLIEVLLRRALEGDVGAARLLLERTIAPLRPCEESATLELPDGSLTDKGHAVLTHIAAGQLAPGQGAAVLDALGQLAKLVEADDLDRRIAALEAKSSSTEGKTTP